MKSALFTILILGFLMAIAGCTAPGPGVSGQQSPPAGESIRPITLPATNLTPSPATLFPEAPIALPAHYRDGSWMGAFEDSFIGSYECSNRSETYSTHYSLLSGGDGPRHIRYTLVPVDPYDEFSAIPLSSDIVGARIVPDDFIALPGYHYRSQITVTIGPDVTGESHTNPDGSGWGHDPYFLFHLNVTADGADVPDADDRISVIKVCSFHSQTREMQATPGFARTPESESILEAGSRQEVNLSVRNFGGGIRELYFKIPARIQGSSWTFPLEADPGQLLPVPDGMTFTFVPPVMIGNNFRLSNSTLIVGSSAGTPPGNYTFPLVLCHRNLNPLNTTSPFFPFDGISWCDTAAQFTVTIV